MINNDLDNKILLLYILSKLPDKVDYESLYDVMAENNISYFDYSDCMADLVNNGNVSKDEDGILITSLGLSSIEAVKNEIPYSDRKKTDKLITPLAEKIRRQSLITANSINKDDDIIVSLGLNDGQCEIFNLKLLVADEEQAEIIKKKFKKSAEKIYKDIIELLL